METKIKKLNDIKLTTMHDLDKETIKKYNLKEGMVVIETWNIDNELVVEMKNIKSMRDYLLSFGDFNDVTDYKTNMSNLKKNKIKEICDLLEGYNLEQIIGIHHIIEDEWDDKASKTISTNN